MDGTLWTGRLDPATKLRDGAAVSEATLGLVCEGGGRGWSVGTLLLGTFMPTHQAVCFL